MSNISKQSSDPSGDILPADAKTTVEMVRDNAPADGSTADVAVASLDNAGSYKKDVFFTFTITKGSAVFVTTGTQNVTVKANPALVATAGVTDMTVEGGEIEVFPTVNNALTATTAYRFSAPSRKLTLALTVDPDNQLADGQASDAVIATLTDDAGQPVAGERLDFSLSAGTARFAGGGTDASQSTGADGKATVWIIDGANADATASVTCVTASAPSVTKTADAHFVAAPKPAIQDFRLQGVVTQGTANDVAPAQVRAVITPTPGSPPADYIVRFSLYGYGNIPYYLGVFTALGVLSGRNGSPEYEVPVTVSGSVATVDVWVHDLDTTTDYAYVQARLLTSAGAFVADSVSASNPRVDFIAASPPAPR